MDDNEALDRDMTAYLNAATMEMFRTNRQEVLCPCSVCQKMVGFSPFTGTIRYHLVRNRFMSGFLKENVLEGGNKDLIMEHDEHVRGEHA